MPRIIIQGWRFLPHSYALVNQFQILEMLRRPGLTIHHQDLPPAHRAWQPVRGLLDAQDEERMANLPLPDGGPSDATYRIGFPYVLGPSTSTRTVVFATAEAGIQPNFFAGGVSLTNALAHSDATLTTPSNWSRQLFIDAGTDLARIVVVPHGVDPIIFHPASAEQRAANRRRAGTEANFVFLHIGAMTGNKNIASLLKAFAIVARHHPHARLALKGVDPLYGSKNLLQVATRNLTEEEISLIHPRLEYHGGIWPLTEIARLYQSADAYVSPYTAEGFNLPALEAAACGLPLICTAGGPTDDFTTPDFALRIDSTLIEPDDIPHGRRLAPNFDSLVAHMLRVIEDHAFTARAATAGPTFVGGRFTWKRVVDQLLRVLVP